ncbi:methyl-accepting chemotaxis sensory transducer [Alkaliphilus metalliredigens QYMF]|uniref:Methyl-accepting chemotaxis sensory transducer n=1 Tax=Alkaliphilus metalliredigens (strain QYMF) TaxID=293826 RepID=A6TUK5_ALKMQ|nr:methyl-accepting chemotaxis protein [Alkaliphilus metalliredigens]ABR49873.1 methyl-accepting chemotaxis sensory transducer [Alkaliphilus metalliredigens QYMF]
MTSIKTKLGIMLGGLLILVCIGLGWVAYFTSTNAVYTVAEELSTKTATESARVVEERINTRFSELLTIANTAEIADPNILPEEKMFYLEKEAKRGGYLSLGIGDTEGETLTMAGITINLKERDYYQQALGGKSVVTDPIISREDNTTLIVNYAVPIQEEGGNIIGVLIGARHGDELSAITNDIVLGDTGTAFMVNQVGTTVAHYAEEAVRSADNTIEMAETDPSLTSLAEIVNRMTTGETGFDEYNYDGIEKFAAFAPVGNTNWSLAVTVPTEEILSSLDSLKSNILMASILFLIFGLLLIYFITSRFARQIKGIAADLNVISNGDFSSDQSIQTRSGKDEIADTYRSMSTMKKAVSAMIKAIKDTSILINKDSESLDVIAQQMSSTSESVATAIQETTQGVSSQAEGLANINEALQTFGEKLEGIVTDIEDIDLNAKDVNDMSNKSNEDMQLLIESINVMESTFKDFTDKINGLNQNVNKVTEITSLINNIAEQTNLLALNAAIEAARAGEAGKGFAVVAQEIRKLAEQSQLSSQNINLLINNITEDADLIIETTDGLNQELSTQVNVIDGVINSYKNIVEAIHSIGVKIRSANIATMEINNEKSTILARVEEASAVAEEVAASSQEIAASSEEMSASSEEVASSAKNMGVLIGSMLEQVNKFKI